MDILEKPQTDIKITNSQRISRFLLSEGKLNADELAHVEQLQIEKGISQNLLLVRLNIISDKDLLTAYSNLSDFPVLDDGHFPTTPVINNELPIGFLKESYSLPIEELSDSIVIAMADPADTYTVKAIELATNKKVIPNVTSVSQIEKMLDRYYGDGQPKLADIVEEIEVDQNETTSDSIERLKDLAAEAPVIRLVNLVINHAIESHASDIHIEPFENRLKIRYRIDGVLKNTEAPPAHSTAAVISRVKIMARMDIAERRLPQDGRIQIKAKGKLIDLRVSTVPTMYGESLVMRILDKEHVNLKFDTLGFTKETKEKIQNAIKSPHGIILVTGPTGSGKTTSLYTALELLNTSDKKILTVEDPVEFELEGINQIQVKPKIGLNFAEALRSIVRQDPDVIMIGEMRDFETASIAVQSALTGHLVFSTLHTNNAGSSITRLLDMGIEDYLLTSTLNGILSQRLVRTLCNSCKKEYMPAQKLINELKLKQYCSGNDITLFKADGCSDCVENGYIGRHVITEFLEISDPIRRLILSHTDSTTLQNEAINQGMDTMQVDGIKKALKGITTIEDVMRVTKE